MTEENAEVVSLLCDAYQAEVSTALNYRALSISLEGHRGELIADHLEEEVDDEFEHSGELASHLDTNYDVVVDRADQLPLENPGFPNPRHESSDEYVRRVIQGVIDDEAEAIGRYRRLCEVCEEEGLYSTRHLAEELLADEIEHKDEFESLIKKFE